MLPNYNNTRLLTDAETNDKSVNVITDAPIYKTSQFNIVNKSVFEIPANAIVNSVNTVGVMGAGIALEFKKRYPKMYADYKLLCDKGLIRPGDCHSTVDRDSGVYILNLAIKNDWRHWGTLEWLESSIKSLKLVLLENDIKSVNLPVLGGKNGRRGPLGKVPNMKPIPVYDEIVEILQRELEPFAIKFNKQINLCIPTDKPKKEDLTHELFFDL